MKRIKLAIIICTALTINISCESSIENKVIAHRGAWKSNKLPQNSIASLEQAIKIGSSGSEFDVWMTIDNVLVINHDPTYQGMKIEYSTYEELSTENLKNGEVLPTLEDYIVAGKGQTGTKLILEIKSSKISKERTLELTEKCVETVIRLKAQKLIDYICFDYQAGLRILELDEDAIVSYLAWSPNFTLDQIKEDGFAGIDYHLNAYKQNPDYIKKAKKLGLVTNVWTVNNAAEMKWFLDKDIDYITTDKPELLLNLTEDAHIQNNK